MLKLYRLNVAARDAAGTLQGDHKLPVDHVVKPALARIDWLGRVFEQWLDLDNNPKCSRLPPNRIGCGQFATASAT
jgi:hypothetical protein